MGNSVSKKFRIYGKNRRKRAWFALAVLACGPALNSRVIAGDCQNDYLAQSADEFAKAFSREMGKTGIESWIEWSDEDNRKLYRSLKSKVVLKFKHTGNRVYQTGVYSSDLSREGSGNLIAAAGYVVSAYTNEPPQSFTPTIRTILERISYNHGGAQTEYGDVTIRYSWLSKDTVMIDVARFKC